jgi:uncharacterized protein (TIGR02145 family)
MEKHFLPLLLTLLVLVSSIKAQDRKPTVTKPQPKSGAVNNTYGTVTDIDGNVYRTVKIGNQVWMAENLKTSHYNDGISIPNVTDGKEWSNLMKGAYCYYDNDYSNNAKYGKLYNWYAVNTGKLAPKGWHVPSDKEWQQLLDYLGGDKIAGNNLKSTRGWDNNRNGTNSSGFSGLPGGCRYLDGQFSRIGFDASWWSSTKSNTYDDAALNRDLYYSPGSDYRDLSNKEIGLSVRCLKN